MLDTHLNQEEVDTMVKNNKQTFQEFYEPILIPSHIRGIMVLLRKSCPFKLVSHKEVTNNCLLVKLESASKPKFVISRPVRQALLGLVQQALLGLVQQALLGMVQQALLGLKPLPLF